ncbi:trypsin-like serine peptidase [Pseudomonas folii]|uniref:Trypsin-like peptidase domain-containing protein n=1 Tax=Pseudomonas folii TaxID=2762593 RepID=A0ABR7B2U3_9PSED|nr:trypsin-like peptidase domain-containing protein [Pseudomonas folii]MBC3951472.1 trypsin-like peptidase domain-containing protein [Pseudomonas folii]
MKTKFSALTGCAFAVCFWAAGAHTKDFGDGLENLSPSRVLANQKGQNDHWRGIGRIESDTGRSCTATLIDTRSVNNEASAPAYVLTSGHCLYRKNNGVIITDHQVTGTVTFNYFADTVEHQQRYPLKRVNWSSMQGVDLAIVELQASLESLIAAGIEPLQIAEKTPQADTNILIVGAPLAFQNPYLRSAACTHQPSGALIVQPWVWRHTVKNQCKDLKEGSSGSPALTRDNNRVFAVINTVTPSGGNFGNPISYLRPCFVAGQLSTDPEICPLFPTFSVEPVGHILRYTKVRLAPDGKEIYPDWNVAFSIDKPFYRFKTVREAIECENPNDYSHAIEATNARVIDQIGPQTGTHMLCLLGIESGDERPSPGLMRNALTFATELQAAGPPSPAQVQFTQRSGRYIIKWDYDPSLVSRQTFKFGPAQTTACDDPGGYRGAWRTLYVKPNQLPVKICTYAYDHADQPSAVREDVLEKMKSEAG